MSYLRGALVLGGLLLAIAGSAPATAAPATDDVQFAAGLVCDTKAQAERVVALLGDGIESALGVVNQEAGTPNACLVATMGFKRGETVSEVLRDGAVFDVIEITLMAVATNLGLQPVEPKKYFSIVATGDRIA